MQYLVLLGAGALLLLVWAACRTPKGPKRDAENRRASQVADRSSAQVQFGSGANEAADEQ